METVEVDTIVIGAGISGIDAAYHLQTHCPNKKFVVLERRQNLGGTWDLFRYPGIRSDSDMFTFGYEWHPWPSSMVIAPGKDILQYLNDCVDAHGLRRHIRFGTNVRSAGWCSAEGRWRVTTTENTVYSSRFLFLCTGYYNYEQPHDPLHDVAGKASFLDAGGTVVHPQRWTSDIDYKRKRVAVIGSGATAATLVPAMVEGGAAHVTMVQRSPTYYASRPPEDFVAKSATSVLPQSIVHPIFHWWYAFQQLFFYKLLRGNPRFAKKALVGEVHRHLEHHMQKSQIDRHFTPRYDVWDQRLCLTPNGDLFGAIRTGKASVVTDEGGIDMFTPSGLRTADGTLVEADLIVTATGLTMEQFAFDITIDGEELDIPNTMMYKGMMLSGVPNMAFVVGYTNASWTLKADLVCNHVCRLLNHMSKHGYAVVTPVADPGVEVEDSWDVLTSGYIQRAKELLPKQGVSAPWRLHQNVLLDNMELRFGSVDTNELKFDHDPKSRDAKLRPQPQSRL